MNDRTLHSANALPSNWLPWLVALAGFAFDLAAYWPGQMSFDSAYAWWQARGGATTDITPPIFVRVWRICDALMTGPGLLFALHLVLFWSGLALLADALRLDAKRTVALMLIAAFAPVPWLLRGHVWTDVGLFSALLFVTGVLAHVHANGKRVRLMAALPALFYAATVRHNAMPALLPLIVWTIWLAMRSPARTPRVARMVVGTIVACAVLIAASALINSRVARHVPLWPATAEWDLAAISIASNEMLLPDFMIGPGLDIAELAGAFREWSITPMLQNTRHGMRDPFMDDFTPEHLATLRSAWFGAIRAHPQAWFAHHVRQARALLGVHDPSWPRELIYVDDEFQYRDNPHIARNESALHKGLMRGAAKLSATPLLAGWPYLLIGLLAVPAAWRRRDGLSGVCSLVLLASTWLYVAPLIVLVPAELRYLGWPCLASVLAAAIAWLARHPIR